MLCTATKRALDAKNLDYRTISVNNSPEAADELRALGVQQVPVVRTEHGTWSGFRPDKIAELAE